MLKHAHRGNAVKALVAFGVELAVVGQLKAHGQVLRLLCTQPGLFFGDGQAHAVHAMAAGRVQHQTAPAATNVEQRHARLQLQLLANQLQLGLLRLRQRLGTRPIAAAVGHGRIQHGLVQIVAQVVMHLAHLPGAVLRLQVGQARLERRPQPTRSAHLLVQPRPQDAGDEFVHLVAIPPAIHITLAQAQTAARQDAVKCVRVVHPHVPRPAAPDPDIGRGQQVTCPPPVVVGAHQSRFLSVP